MLAKLIFVIIAVNFHPSSAINCLFVGIEPDHYGCEVLADQFNITTKEVTGNHQNNKTDVDVTALFINGKNEVEFSSIFCRVFVNLQHIHIETLEIAVPDDFTDCRNVRELKIIGTELSWLSEGTFMNMRELRVLKLSANKLVYLPADMLINNLKLEKFLAPDNRLETIDLQFSSNIKEIDLQVSKKVIKIVDKTSPFRPTNASPAATRVLSSRASQNSTKCCISTARVPR